MLPAVGIQLVQHQRFKAELLRQVEHAGLLHHLARVAHPAAVAHHDAAGLALLQRCDHRAQHVRMRGPGCGVGAVKVGLEKDVFACRVRDAKERQRLPHAVGTIGGLDQGDTRLRVVLGSGRCGRSVTVVGVGRELRASPAWHVRGQKATGGAVHPASSVHRRVRPLRRARVRNRDV